MAEKDLYAILQVHPQAEQVVIEAAYRKLIRKYYPDVNQSPDAHERTVELNDAYAVLSDPARRRSYDAGSRQDASKPAEEVKSPPRTSTAASGSSQAKTSQKSTKLRESNTWQTFSREVKEGAEDLRTCTGSLGCNVVVTALAILSMLALSPGVLLFVPLYRTFVSKRANNGAAAWGALVLINLLIFATAFVPFMVVRAAEDKFGTDQLCEVCGRPGEVVWYERTTKPGEKRGHIYCKEHNSQAPGTVSVSESYTVGEKVETPGSGVGGTVFFALFLWGIGLMYIWALSRREIDKAAVLSFSLLVSVGACVIFSNLTWIHTLNSP